MSYLPKLSEKAKVEIFRFIQNKSFPFVISEAFYEGLQNLFDLEKYPITFDMLLEYVSTMSEYNIYDKGNKEFVLEFDPEPRRKRTVRDKAEDIEEALKFIWSYSNIRDIDLIASIHGWWEQPQTY